MIPIAKPVLGQEEIEAVVQIMESGIIAQGETVYQFEEAFAKHFNYAHAAAISNGTAALHVTLLAAGIKQGDKVLTTPFSFIATTNAILYCGAIPCFVDVDPGTFNISPASLEEQVQRNPDAKYVLITHLFGQPCDMKEIMRIVNSNQLILIEDCAQAHGATYEGKPVGSFGIAGTFSFYPTKNMTTGEGGMIVSNDEKFLQLVKTYINHGSNTRYVHEITGYNYRMTNIAAAIGIVQLQRIDNWSRKRAENATYYTQHLNSPYFDKPICSNPIEHVYHQYTLKTNYRDSIANYLDANRIGYGIYYPKPIHYQQNIIQYFNEIDKPIPSLPVAEKLADEVISIPVHPMVTKDELKTVVEVLNAFRP